MRTDIFNKIISKNRIDTYRNHDKETTDILINRYFNNIRISEAFYPVLNFLEISLRNNINNIMIKDCGENWLEIYPLEEIQKTQVKEAINKLKKHNKEITNYRMVAELNFGFWTSMFNKNHENLWKENNRITRIFPKNTPSIPNIRSDLIKIRNFRNRIFHYENIYRYNPKNSYNLVMRNLLKMISTDAYDKISEIDRLKNCNFDFDNLNL